MSFAFGQPAQSKPFSFSTTSSQQPTPSFFQTAQQQTPSFFQTAPQQQQQQQQQPNVFSQANSTISAPGTSGFSSSFGNPQSTSSTTQPTPFSSTAFSNFSSSIPSSITATNPQVTFQAPTPATASVLSVPIGYPQQKLPATPENIVRSVREAWDPASPYCQFKHYFYNLVHPSEVKKYTRGPNDDEKLWEHAVKNNPDPTCLVPALAVGFGDLKKRAQEQDKYLRNMRYRLGEISIALDLLSQRHETDNRTRIQEIKRSHQAISGRVLSLMKKIHCMRNKGLVLNLGEDRLKGRLEALEFQLKKPGQYKTRLATLWRELSVLGTAMVDPASEKVIAADAEKLHKVLSDQYQGISHVIDVIKEDQHDLDVMEKLLKRESDAMFDSVSLT